MTVQCTGTTKAGNQCKRRVKIGNRCRSHNDNKKSKFVCGAPRSKKGGSCTQPVKIKGDKCISHGRLCTKPIFICGASKSRGKITCKQPVKAEGDKCRDHKDDKIICSIVSNDGKPCSTAVKVKGDKCSIHNGSRSTRQKFVCGEPNRYDSGTCKREVKEGEKCYDHNDKPRPKLYPDVEPEEKHEDKFCPLCKELVEWKWMGNIGFSRYQLSHDGRVYNVMRKEYLDGSTTIDGYKTFGLTNDNDDKLKTTHLTTLFRLAYFKLEPWSKENNITMDHINRKKEDNYVCNLRPATPAIQANNKTHSITNKGKKVIRTSKDNDLTEEYESVVQAANTAKVIPETIRRHCRNGVHLNGYLYRYFGKEDLPGHIWKSTKELYPQIQPPIEVSDGGWICTSNGMISRGGKHGYYYRIGIMWKGERKHKYVHVLVWTVFNNMLVPDGYEISHKKSKGEDNRLINLEACTHSKNIRTTIANGMNKNATRVRKYFHDGKFIDYVSVREAVKDTKEASKTLILNALHGEGVAGMCLCGKGYTWTRI